MTDMGEGRAVEILKVMRGDLKIEHALEMMARLIGESWEPEPPTGDRAVRGRIGGRPIVITGLEAVQAHATDTVTDLVAHKFKEALQ